MTLTLLGLILNFLGSAMLIYYALKGLGKQKPCYFPPNEEYGWEAQKLEPEKDGFYKRVRYTSEEIKLFISLLLISDGFFLQILDFFV